MNVPSPINSKPTLKEEEIRDIKDYKINLDKKAFVVKIGKLNYSQKVVFIVEEESNMINHDIYKSRFSLEDLRQISKLLEYLIQ